MEQSWILSSLLIGSVILGASDTVCSQIIKKTNSPTSVEKPKSAPPQGYLSHAPHPGLRFAAPPKPPVAYLPPLPITYDPQPIFSSEFAPPTTDLPVSKTTMPSPSSPPTLNVPVAALTSNFTTNRTGSIPSAPVDMGSVSPQMLVRFFQNGKPRDIEILLTNAVNFRVPVPDEKPSSSASYEVK